MDLKNHRESSNIEDKRQNPLAHPRVKMSGIALILAVLASLVTGKDPSSLIAQLTGNQASPLGIQDAGLQYPPQDEHARFVSVILASTEDSWSALLPAMHSVYRKPKLVLYSGRIKSACGNAEAAMGPFYCASDQKIYLDLSFFKELHKLGAPGDFAQAYVIGHEIGHHVQNLLGISGKIQQQRNQLSTVESNALSVLLELQADCFAGVWASYANRQQPMLEPGDMDEGLQAAAAVGDDSLQKQGGGNVFPEAFTHGSSEQRVFWLKKGLEKGLPGECDTFGSGKV
ncbi:MAG: flagellar biosynthesis protein FlgM [Methylobacter sp.]|nr:MAG: flagellar biosynthesis protein FlgM [Methylobacter sp.]